MVSILSGYIWDVFRPVADAATKLDPVIKSIVFLLAIAMFFLSLSAYFKTKSRKFFFISAAFFLFAVKWGIKIFDVFLSPGTFFSDSAENVFELLIFASLFLAIFRK